MSSSNTIPDHARDFLEAGTPAPVFAAPVAENHRILESEAIKGRSTLLVFAGPYCAACRGIGEDIEALRRRKGVQVVVLCQGKAEDCVRWGADNLLGNPLLLVDEGRKITAAFHIKETPTAVLVDEVWKVQRYGIPGSAYRFGLMSWEVAKMAEGSTSISISVREPTKER
ncbi:MAG: hypothetical protein C4293_18760 [Nitrospiraceae bacterium]